MAGITMYDTICNNRFPPGAQAYAAYVDGSVGNQPNYAHVVKTFPSALHLSIAVFPGNNADALDVEPGAAGASAVPAWYARQKQRGIQRPCVYASASMMQGSVLPVLNQGEDRPGQRPAVDRAPRGPARCWRTSSPRTRPSSRRRNFNRAGPTPASTR